MSIRVHSTEDAKKYSTKIPSGYHFKFKEADCHGIDLGNYYKVIDKNMVIEILDEINKVFPLHWADVDIFCVPFRPMIYDNGWTGNEYNGRAWKGIIILGARKNVEKREVASMLIHELWHEFAYRYVDDNPFDKRDTPIYKKFKDLMDIENFTDKSIFWEDRPSEILAELGRWFSKNELFTWEEFLPFNSPSDPKPKREAYNYLISLMPKKTNDEDFIENRGSTRQEDKPTPTPNPPTDKPKEDNKSNNGGDVKVKHKIKVRKIRRFGTDIHVVSYLPKPGLLTTLTQDNPNKKQKLSDMDHGWFEKNGYKQIGAINMSFFGFNGNPNPIGFNYVDGGFLTQPPSDTDDFMEVMYTKDNKLVFDNINLDKFNKQYKDKVYWGTALSYTLVIDGKKDIRNTEPFSHHKTNNPRTFIGQNQHTGEIFWCVAEGRNPNDAGLTADEQADVMLELGATLAINADGGGSSTLEIDGAIINYLSDGSERPLANALMLYTKDDYEIEYEEEEKPLLIIDAGHGGKDPGSGNNKFWTEKDMALDISLYQYSRFKELGIPVAMTRTTDITLDPGPRTNLVKASGAKFCISNHINAGGGDGAEVIHSIFNDGKLANMIMDEIVAAGQNKRRVFTRESKKYPGRDYYYMHRLTGFVTTMIVEYGFADSKLDDVDQLKDDGWKKYAEAAVKGFCKYINHPYIPPKNIPGDEQNEPPEKENGNDGTIGTPKVSEAILELINAKNDIDKAIKLLENK